ncbi:MAG: hypothetical protein ACYTBP_05105 [Planctomycetota bacterium]|jgi:hypothetical protein
MQSLVIILVIALIIAGIVFGHIAAKKRREDLNCLAQKLGMSFHPEKNYDLDNEYKFLDALRQGSNRYAYNILYGDYKDQYLQVLDYHYETHSTNSKGHQQTHHHHFSFFILKLEKSFPEIKITKEGFFSKIGQALGFDDIDFESHEFSRRFCVRSKDKKFAYDVCNAKMIDYLLDNKDMSIEIENNALALAFNRCLKVEDIEHNMDRLIKVRSLIPEYLFKG